MDPWMLALGLWLALGAEVGARVWAEAERDGAAFASDRPGWHKAVTFLLVMPFVPVLAAAGWLWGRLR